MREANARAILMGGDALASDEFVAAADGGADGSLMIFPQDPKTRPAAADLLRRLRAKGIEPGAYVFYAYAAVQVVQQAMSRSQSVQSAQIAAAMHDQVFRTVLGDVSFDGNGDPTGSDFTVYVWHKGAAGQMTYDGQAR